MKRRLRAPSPALVIALIALFVALGGSSYAAINALPKNSVGAKQLKKNAVTGVKIKKGAVTASKINPSGLTVPSATHATSADSATNATNATNASQLQGHPAGDFASSTAVRVVTINADGTIVAGSSSGIAQSNVTHPAAGKYCINGLSPTPKAGVATHRFGGNFQSQIFVEPTPAGVCNGNQIGVATYDSTNTLSNQPITVVIFS